MRGSAPHMAKSPNSENAWLGREDSNLRMAESKSYNPNRQEPPQTACRHQPPQYSLLFARQNPTLVVKATISGADMVPTR